MEIDFEKRNSAYDSASPTVQKLYSSPESGITMYDVFKKNGLNEEKYKMYAKVVGDIILGFYPKSDLKKLLIEGLHITTEVAEKIELDLAQFLEPIDTVPNNQIATEMVVSESEVIKTPPISEGEPDIAPEPSTKEIHDDGPKPLTREDVLNALAPRKAPEITMPSTEPVEEEKKEDEPLSGYAAYQNDKEGEGDAK